MRATHLQRLIPVKEARLSLSVCQLAADHPTAAVLVWIYGGGYTFGSKSSGSPATLLASARKNNQEGVIFVAMNYRLGLYVSLLSHLSRGLN
jgi:carboxylesterase type B